MFWSQLLLHPEDQCQSCISSAFSPGIHGSSKCSYKNKYDWWLPLFPHLIMYVLSVFCSSKQYQYHYSSYIFTCPAVSQLIIQAMYSHIQQYQYSSHIPIYPAVSTLTIQAIFPNTINGDSLSFFLSVLCLFVFCFVYFCCWWWWSISWIFPFLSMSFGTCSLIWPPTVSPTNSNLCLWTVNSTVSPCALEPTIVCPSYSKSSGFFFTHGLTVSPILSLLPSVFSSIFYFRSAVLTMLQLVMNSLHTPASEHWSCCSSGSSTCCCLSVEH